MSNKLFNIAGNEISPNDAITMANMHCGNDHIHRSLSDVSHPSTIRFLTKNDILPYDGLYKMMSVIKSNCIAMLSEENIVESKRLDENTFYEDIMKGILMSSKFMIIYEQCMSRAIENEKNNAKK